MVAYFNPRSKTRTSNTVSAIRLEDLPPEYARAYSPSALALGKSQITRPLTRNDRNRAEREAKRAKKVVDQRKQNEAVRYRRRGTSQRLLRSVAKRVSLESGGMYVDPGRIAKCGLPISKDVVVTGGTNAAFLGVETCSSIHACPTCSARIRAGRATEIATAVQAHQQAGGTCVFVTLTFSHNASMSLKTTLNAAIKGFGGVMSGRAWKRDKETFGILGYVRATEVTYGENGWHPHVHALLFVDHELSDDQAVQLGDSLHRRWNDRVTRLGAGTPSRAHGVDVQLVGRDGTVLADYLAKVQGESSKPGVWGVDAEIARSDVKSGRQGSRSPFELLDSDTPQNTALWLEYVEATRGRQAITWSEGLRERYELVAVDDDELAGPGESDVDVAWRVSRDEYIALMQANPEFLALILQAARHGDWEQVAIWVDGELVPNPRLQHMELAAP